MVQTCHEAMGSVPNQGTVNSTGDPTEVLEKFASMLQQPDIGDYA